DGDGTPNCNDLCPIDPLKTNPGACGCGFTDADGNGNGTPDCNDTEPTLTLVADASSYTPGETMTVTLSRSASNVPTAGMQLAVDYDETRLLFVSAAPSADSPFASELSEIHDAVNGTLRVAVGISPSQVESATAGAVIDLSFVVLPTASDCAATGLVSFATVGGFDTMLTTDEGVPVTPILTAMPAVSIDGTAPTLSGVPANATAAADAGSLIGGTVLPSVVTVSDNCSGAGAVSVTVTYPNGVTLAGWPAGNLFPIGVSTVHWHASDAAGNGVNASRTVTIGSFQLADVSVLLDGAFAGASVRPIRLSFGGTVSTVNVSMTGPSGAKADVVVPLAAGYACATAKDATHSVSDASAASVSGTKYSISFSLRQGDSTDDNLVDIMDFGAFINARSASVATNAVSNFNADTLVNNADLSFISINFLQVGEVCGSYDGPAPRSRISVKDLRRSGMGHLASADLNRDGWLDTNDVAYYMQFGAPMPAASTSTHNRAE
ncbi:MAG: cohesin domain-containing protein, partial [Planctomycetota bacterium]